MCSSDLRSSGTGLWGAVCQGQPCDRSSAGIRPIRIQNRRGLEPTTWRHDSEVRSCVLISSGVVTSSLGLADARSRRGPCCPILEGVTESAIRLEIVSSAPLTWRCRVDELCLTGRRVSADLSRQCAQAITGNAPSCTPLSPPRPRDVPSSRGGRAVGRSFCAVGPGTSGVSILLPNRCPDA